jgi:hypothetical protein
MNEASFLKNLSKSKGNVSLTCKEYLNKNQTFMVSDNLTTNQIQESESRIEDMFSRDKRNATFHEFLKRDNSHLSLDRNCSKVITFTKKIIIST